MLINKEILIQTPNTLYISENHILLPIFQTNTIQIFIFLILIIFAKYLRF